MNARIKRSEKPDKQEADRPWASRTARTWRTDEPPKDETQHLRTLLREISGEDAFASAIGERLGLSRQAVSKWVLGKRIHRKWLDRLIAMFDGDDERRCELRAEIEKYVRVRASSENDCT